MGFVKPNLSQLNLTFVPTMIVVNLASFYVVKKKKGGGVSKKILNLILEIVADSKNMPIRIDLDYWIFWKPKVNDDWRSRSRSGGKKKKKKVKKLFFSGELKSVDGIELARFWNFSTFEKF